MEDIKEWIKSQNLSESPWHTNDTFILRFCRARKFDFTQTQKMLQDFFKFRDENELDTILDVRK